MCRGDLKWHKKLRHTTFSMQTLLKMLHSLPFQDIQPWEQGCILFGITGLNFPSTYGCNNLNEAEFPSFLDLKQLGCCVLCFPKCFQRRQPEGEEVVLIKSSLCFPGTGAFADVCCQERVHRVSKYRSRLSFPSDTNLPSQVTGNFQKHVSNTCCDTSGKPT